MSTTWIVEITSNGRESYHAQSQKVVTAYHVLKDKEKPVTIEIDTRGVGGAIADYLAANGLPIKRQQKLAACLTAPV